MYKNKYKYPSRINLRKRKFDIRILQQKSLSENSTIECIPKTGMFVFSSESLNYTQAQSFCRKRNASLAHVISEERTEALARFVSQNRPSFVGLSKNDKEGIWKNEFGNRNFFTDLI